jgi:hypothetical protein
MAGDRHGGGPIGWLFAKLVGAVFAVAWWALRQPARVALKAGHQLLAAGGEVAEWWFALAVWAVFSFGMLAVAAWVRNVRLLEPVQWATATVGTLGVISLWGFFLTMRWRRRHANHLWMVRIEQGQAQVVEAANRIVAAVPSVVPEGVAVLRSVKDDEGYRDAKERNRQQSEQVREMIGDDEMPMGDRFEPVFRLPKRFRRKPRKGDDAE